MSINKTFYFLMFLMAVFMTILGVSPAFAFEPRSKGSPLAAGGIFSSSLGAV